MAALNGGCIASKRPGGPNTANLAALVRIAGGVKRCYNAKPWRVEAGVLRLPLLLPVPRCRPPLLLAQNGGCGCGVLPGGPNSGRWWRLLPGALLLLTTQTRAANGKQRCAWQR